MFAGLTLVLRTASIYPMRTIRAVVYLLRQKGHYLHCYLVVFVAMALSRGEAYAANKDSIAILDISDVFVDEFNSIGTH